jgi:hypothetical protein
MMEYFWRSGLSPNEMERLCQLPTWTVEEAVALSIGFDPSSISPQSIAQFKHHLGDASLGEAVRHPFGYGQTLAVPSSLKDDLQFARLYMARHDHLMRAARIGKLPAAPFNGSFDIKPLDFLAWYKRQNGQVPWHALPKELTAHFGLDISSDISGDQRGVYETWRLMLSEMSKPLAERRFATMTVFKAHCEATFKIRHHDFEILRTKAINTPRLTSWPTGRPKRAK